MENLTPMLAQYEGIKSKYKDCILFFRLGDFYEMFYDDAKSAAKILDLVLTSRGAGRSGKVPMCGIPYHAADSYISRLIKAGLKVAICEQVEDPALAKGIVRRDVIRIISSGTFIDESTSSSRYIVALSPNKNTIGLAFTDNINGVIQVNEYPNMEKIIEIIAKLPVYECVFPTGEEEKVRGLFSHPVLKMKNIALSAYEDWCFNLDIAEKTLKEHFGTHTLKGFGIDGMIQATISAGALLEYLQTMHRQPARHIDRLSLYIDSDYVFLSPAAVQGLGIEQLIETIDKTITPMGKRKLRYWIFHPLKNPIKILERQSAVGLLKESPAVQKDLGSILHNIPDIEKSISRISCGYSHAKDFLALRNTLIRIPLLQKAVSILAQKNTYGNSFSIVDIPYIRELLEKAINPDCPISNPEGKLINKGYDLELDKLRDMQENGKKWLQNLQREEVKRTRINSLKIGFNQVFGYYIEITKPNLHLVPDDYIRKQTLVNAERFITAQLKEFEENMLTAEEKILKIETRILQDLQKEILDNSISLHQFSESLATLDGLYSLSILARLPGYTAPQITEDTQILITDGRHPVVEQLATQAFIPNDTVLDCSDNHLLIITGPNMSGKSTYIRQVALLVIMAQAGSFIPAGSSRIGIVDKIFTRIGAHDEITRGQSTFMVEMSETAEILNNLSPASLVILDEIGRGTSTFDGLSLAWAIAEYLYTQKARTLFATHFHELTSLEEEYKGIKNYNVAVKKWKDEVIFLHKIVPGGTDDSYGIYVAKLAGIPKDVLERSKQILTQLELYGSLDEKIRKKTQKEIQLPLFSNANDQRLSQIKDEIRSVDINSLTPLEALEKINEWKKRLLGL